MKDLKSFNFQGKRVLVRCDFNVPLDEEGVILDDFRIRKTIPTIEYLLKEKGRVILMSHMGRPLQSSKFKVQSSKFSLKTVAGRLSELLNRGVGFSEDCVGEEVEEKVSRMEEGDILLLENLRFHKDEENNNEEFSRSLSHLADIYINDAFSVCHRSHASVVGITKYLPSGAGLLLEKEIEILSKIMENPEKPLGLIIAGTKAEDKVKVIEKFLDIADFFLL
ncbi:MAG: phosphoglycerate kinase, partial [Candidatus Nealsonbacteria bacterium CG_4_8_14_3_um_filter_39_7]